MAGHSRSKNGVASLAYVRAIPLRLALCIPKRDTRAKRGYDLGGCCRVLRVWSLRFAWLVICVFALGVLPVAAQDFPGIQTFASVDEMLVLVELPMSAWERIRDRAVTLTA